MAKAAANLVVKPPITVMAIALAAGNGAHDHQPPLAATEGAVGQPT
jgi:hypothetical protein